MARVPPVRFDVEALRVRLCERIAAVRPLVVADVMRVFLEVSSLPCELMLWSLAFAFDEDDGRIARLEARFSELGAPASSGEGLPGYEVELLLPNVIPPRAPADVVRAGTEAPRSELAPDSLVARFVCALADVGSYRTIEPLEARSVDVYLL